MKKLSPVEIREKHLQGVRVVRDYFYDHDIAVHTTFSNDDVIRDERYIKLNEEYDKYEAIAEGRRRPFPRSKGIYSKPSQEYVEKQIKNAQNLIKKYRSKRVFVEEMLERPRALDYFYMGDMQFFDDSWGLMKCILD